jgi:hypothetical protein
MLPNSLVVNRARWDERAPAHAASPQYDVDRFRLDPGFLSKVVRFDVPRLGDLRGVRCVHLRCRIGTPAARRPPDLVTDRAACIGLPCGAVSPGRSARRRVR